MLVLTIQDSVVAQKMKDGRYEADFWKSKFGCASARFTRGYKELSKALYEQSGNSCEVPIFAWGGSPFIESVWDTRDKKAVFLEVPDRLLVYSDYDLFCDYVHGNSSKLDFMLPRKKAKDRIKRGYCVQVCLPYVMPEWIVSVVDFSMLKNYKGTVSDCCRYCKLLKSYIILSEKES